MKLELQDKWLYFPTILLALHFIYRLIDQSKLLYTFPLDITNDISSYMAQLFFLDKCGFHNLCSYWYNGFISFQFYPPGWYFFTFPLYKIFDNVLIATYLSLILIFIMGFFLLYKFGKTQKLSKMKRVCFFFLFFGNAIAVGNFIRLGRITELFSWIVFVSIMIVLFYYKDKKIDYRFFLLFIPLYALQIITHQTEVVLIQSIFLGFFLIKQSREKIHFILAVISSLALSSFWWVPFITDLYTKSSVLEYTLSETLWDFSSEWLLTNIAAFFVPLALFITFYFYWKSSHKSKKELLFYGPMLIVGLIFFLRLTPFVPLLKNVYPDPHMTFFLFFIILFFLMTSYSIYPKFMKTLILISLIVIPIISVLANVYHTPKFQEHTELERNTLELLEKVEGKFLVYGPPEKTSYSKAYYSYAPIYLNLSTPSGWANMFITQEEKNRLLKLSLSIDNQQCDDLNKLFVEVQADELITYDPHCSKVITCGFIQRSKKNNVCLLRYDHD